VVKNKVAPPFKTADFDILYNEGISREGEIIEIGVQHRIVEKSGASFSFEGERLGHGRDRALEHLKEHPAIIESLRARLAIVSPTGLQTDGIDPSEAAKAG